MGIALQQKDCKTKFTMAYYTQKTLFQAFLPLCYLVKLIVTVTRASNYMIKRNTPRNYLRDTNRVPRTVLFCILVHGT